jgi:hypothetical protein
MFVRCSHLNVRTFSGSVSAMGAIFSATVSSGDAMFVRRRWYVFESLQIFSATVSSGDAMFVRRRWYVFESLHLRLPLPQGKIVHPKHSGGGARRDGQPPEEAQQRVPAHHQAPLVAAVHASLATQRPGNGHETLGEPSRVPRPGGGHGGQAFGEDAAMAVTIAAEPRADVQRETHAVRRPLQIGEGPCVTAVETPRRCGAQGTGHAGLRRAHPQGNLRRGGVDVTGDEVSQGGIG